MLHKLMQELVPSLKRKKREGVRLSMVGLFHRTLSPMRPLRHRQIARDVLKISTAGEPLRNWPRRYRAQMKDPARPEPLLG